MSTLPSLLFIKEGNIINRLGKADEQEFSTLFESSKAASASQVTASSSVPLKEPSPSEYDLVVIGGGSGGLAAAKEAAKHGARVALFDYVKPSPIGTTWGFGGTCVNVGCIPKKLMHYTSLCGESMQDARGLGWRLPDDVPHDWETMVATVQAHVKKLNFFYESGVKSPQKQADGTLPHAGVWYFNALARFESTHEVSWRDDFNNVGRVYGKHFIIAVGGRPLVPSSLPGKELVITSDDLFSLKHSPGKVLCVGAGYISLECGGFLTNLGNETHISVRSTPLRTGFDRDAASLVVELMSLQGTKFLMGTVVKQIVKDASSKLKVTFEWKDGRLTDELYDTVLYAIGRYSDTAALNLSAAGLEEKDFKDGKLIVDEAERTTVQDIFAIGDCATGVKHTIPELTPVAVQSGELLARRLFVGSKVLMNYENVATTVFTPFELGAIGLPEHEAVERYGAENIEIFLKVYESLEIGAVHRHTAVKYFEKDWDDAKKTHVLSDRESTDLPPMCLAKLVCLKSENDRVVGLHYVGPNAGEVTQGFAVAMKLGATKADFDSTVGIHPTDAESFTMLEVTKRSGQNWIASGGCGGGKCG